MRTAKRHIIGIIMLITGVVIYTPNVANTLQVDPTKSHIKFTAKHLLGGSVEGEFLGYSVMIQLKDTTTIERIEALIDTNSIFTNNKIRDRHLRQPRFLDYKKYDYITFIAQGPIAITDRSIKGLLSIKGVTKEIELPVKFNFLQSKVTGQLVLSSKVENMILNRNDYEVDGLPMIIKDHVTVDIELMNKVYLKMGKL